MRPPPPRLFPTFPSLCNVHTDTARHTASFSYGGPGVDPLDIQCAAAVVQDAKGVQGARRLTADASRPRIRSRPPAATSDQPGPQPSRPACAVQIQRRLVIANVNVLGRSAVPRAVLDALSCLLQPTEPSSSGQGPKPIIQCSLRASPAELRSDSERSHSSCAMPLSTVLFPLPASMMRVANSARTGAVCHRRACFGVHMPATSRGQTKWRNMDH